MLPTEALHSTSGLPRMLPIGWPQLAVQLIGVFLMAAVVITFVLQMSSQARQTLGQIIQARLIAPQSMTNLSEPFKSPHNMSKMFPPQKSALVLLVASLTVAIAISIVGAVSLAGLLVPHLAGFLDGSMHTRVLLSAILANGYLLLIDYLCRNVFSTEIPLGFIPVVLGLSVLVTVLMWIKRQWF